MPAPVLWFAQRIPKLARSFPELFFVFVLGGEEPIDQMQRLALRGGHWRHPLPQRISQIHVIEEARHMSFARAYLVRHVPRLSFLRKNFLALRAPLILGNMVPLMLRPSPQLVHRFKIPRAVMDQAFRDNAAFDGLKRDAVAKTRELCGELGLMNGPYGWLWRRFGLT
jgi:hypothetical protein